MRVCVCVCVQDLIPGFKIEPVGTSGTPVKSRDKCAFSQCQKPHFYNLVRNINLLEKAMVTIIRCDGPREIVDKRDYPHL